MASRHHSLMDLLVVDIDIADVMRQNSLGLMLGDRPFNHFHNIE
jgi:hypothetical protein